MTTTTREGLQLALVDPANELLDQLIEIARESVERLKGLDERAAVGRLRGCGPGVSFRDAVDTWERRHPVELAYPFESNTRVGGAVWPGAARGEGSPDALMKLRWESRANDLPMHSHEYSDRCIIVLKGRGFYHISDEPVDGFTGQNVRTIAARERDVFVFRRGVVHTFSTFDHPMLLLSCHLPFIPLDDRRQYVLPEIHWTASERLSTNSCQTVQLGGWADLSVRD